MDMDNLARYIVLDSPLQQEKFPSKVRNTEQLAEYFTQRKRWQERRMKRIVERQEKYSALYGRTLGPKVPFILKSESTVRLYEGVIGRQYVELQFINNGD
ncbi:hypothetical protein HOY82DRAFT_612504 [Tuber indicum]|nr:hypothetical protein HOY82DRAFT_612504 [Tuber indicum]